MTAPGSGDPYLDKLNSIQDLIDRRLGSFETRLTAIENNVEARLKGQEELMLGVSGKVQGLEGSVQNETDQIHTALENAVHNFGVAKQRFDTIDHRANDVDKKTEASFGAVEERFTGVDQSLKAIGSRVARIDQGIASLGDQVAAQVHAAVLEGIAKVRNDIRREEPPRTGE